MKHLKKTTGQLRKNIINDHQYFLYRRMKSQNSKEQKSDFSYKETLNLLKTDFSMRANSVVREPEIQNLIFGLKMILISN